MPLFSPIASQTRLSQRARRRSLTTRIAFFFGTLVAIALLIALAIELCFLFVSSRNQAAILTVYGLGILVASVLVAIAPWIAVTAISTDDISLSQLKLQRSLDAKTRHHRRWWDLNLIVLFVGLLSLTYVRHFLSVDRDFILWSALFVFLGWIGLRQIGWAVQEIYDRRRL